MNIFIVLLIVVIFFALQVALEYRARFKPVSSLEKFSKTISGNLTQTWNGINIAGFINGSVIRLGYLPRRRKFFFFKQEPAFIISLRCEIKGGLSIRRKSYEAPGSFVYDDFPVVKVGNQLFDREYSIHSPYPDFVMENFKQGDKRQAVRRIFSLGANIIYINSHFISVIWNSFDAGEDIDESLVKETFEKLNILTKNMQSTTMEEVKDDQDELSSFVWLAFAFLIFTITFFILFRYFT